MFLGYVPTVKNEWGFKRIALVNAYSGGYRVWTDQSGQFVEVVRLDRGITDNKMPIRFDVEYHIDKFGVGHIILTNISDKKAIRYVTVSGTDSGNNVAFVETELIEFNSDSIELTCNGVIVKDVKVEVL